MAPSVKHVGYAQVVYGGCYYLKGGGGDRDRVTVLTVSAL